MAKLFSIYILFIVAFLAIFHVARYAWVLHAIQRDRVICFVEPDPKVQIDGDEKPQIPSIHEILTNFKAVLPEV